MSSDCLSAWQRERYHLGYVTGEQSSHMAGHVEDCVTCHSQIHALQEEVHLPPLDWSQMPSEPGDILPDELLFAPDSTPDMRPVASLPWWVMLWNGWRPMMALGAVATLVVLWFAGKPLLVDGPDTLDGGRFKGASVPSPSRGMRWKGAGNRLTLFVKRHVDGTILRAKEAQPVSTRDTVRFGLTVKRKWYMMVASINEKGEVSLYVPHPSRMAIHVKEGRHRFPENKSIPLDAYTGRERFVMVGSTKSFHFSQLKDALQQAFRASNQDLNKLVRVEGFSWFRMLSIKKVRHR
jgi:hypothetical protein